MDPFLDQRRVLKASLKVSVACQALVDKIDRVIKSDQYARFMLFAKKHGVAFEGMDLELADCVDSLDGLRDTLAKSSAWRSKAKFGDEQ